MPEKLALLSILLVYAIGLVVITLYAVGQLHLVWLDRRHRRTPERVLPPLDPARPDLPVVTVQLPMYNEQNVAEQAIDCAAQLRWPADRLEIQVLDDSTDATTRLVQRRVQLWRERGIDIDHLRRTERTGFKAGALAAGQARARGEFIAVFDADFRPAPDFLLRTIPYFDAPAIGIVQARWGHANREHSLLTRIEAALLDIFFVVEQPARALGGFFLRFNGSAGVWRRTCIDDAGGWSADTLAEDLDLSYRAQLRGWRARYAGHVVVDAELPVTLDDFRRQQFRWVRGTAQVVRKLGGRLTRARLPVLAKVHAWVGLLNVIAVLAALATALLSVPVAWTLHGRASLLRGLPFDTSFALLPLFVWFLCVLRVVREHTRGLLATVHRAVALFLPMLATILGLTLSLGIASLGGLIRKGGEFVRTPKLGGGALSQDSRTRRIERIAWLELALLAYFAMAVGFDVRLGARDFLPMHIALVSGYASVLLQQLVPAPIPVRRTPRTARRLRTFRTTVARWFAALLLLAPLTTGRAHGQTSLVPAQHPVYEWLHRQRVMGRLDGFAFESVPLSRADIARHLAALDARDDLGRTDHALLDTYLREFSRAGLETSARESILHGEGGLLERVPRMLRDYAEPHLLAWADEEIGFALDLFGSIEYASLDDGGVSYTSPLIARGVRAWADFYGHFGVHLEAGNLHARGDRQVLAHDPLYGKTFEVVRQGKDNSNYFEAYASARYGAIGVHIGHGGLRFGPGPGEPLFLARDASKFDWVRLDLDTRLFRYVMLHGSLAADAEDGILILAGADTVLTRIAPQRWLALHRMEFTPVRTLRLSLTEMIAYSARGLDLAYVNPVAPLFFAELDNHDRDNAVLGLDITWRPVSGLELWGGVFVDDADDALDLVRPSGGEGAEQRAFDLGAMWASRFGLDAGARYVRIEPFVYTHFQRLNTLEQRGFPLGNALGPNADAGQLWTRLWLPRRSALSIGWSRVRKGLNPIDVAGMTAANVGGDLLDGTDQVPFDFLELADVQSYDEVAVEAVTEPLRGLRLQMRYERRNVRKGDRFFDRDYFDLRLLIGF